MSVRSVTLGSAVVILTLVPAVRVAITLAQVTRDVAPSAPELHAAWSTYLTQCSQCHGTDANGTAAAANLRAFKGSEDDFLRIVRDGRAGTAMTPWKGLISDDEIRNMAAISNN
jgi:mono/diheme cytochrome c family protein